MCHVIIAIIIVHSCRFIVHNYSLAKQQLLAVGDAKGALNIFEIPWALRQPVNQELQRNLFRYDSICNFVSFILQLSPIILIAKRNVEHL